MTELEDARAQLEVFARELGQIHRQERERSKDLERMAQQLHEANLATMKTLAYLVEARDAGTRHHLDRSHDYGVALTRLLDPALAARPEVGYGFLLHDIGKIGISETLLTKHGRLTDDEWVEMRTHPVIGAQMVSEISFLGDAVDVIRCHHERYDGTGYPSGLRGEEIPLLARIFSVVDAFDAMTSERPYRRAWSVERAVDEVLACSGTHFDPDVVEAFVLMTEDPPLVSVGAAS